mmetsp:Transcript_20398/g.19376  ORF Transcript_20398/g.19376 Transcript_20398/m.19376 type:complete len:239 (+) Transcript_20398:1255-1971(+)
MGAGDHDIGMNSLSEIEIDEDYMKQNVYFTYFPQNYPRIIQDDGMEVIISTSVPEIKYRSDYFVHYLSGSTALYTLDYGYTQQSPYLESGKVQEISFDEGSDQLKWLEYRLEHDTDYEQRIVHFYKHGNSLIEQNMFYNQFQGQDLSVVILNKQDVYGNDDLYDLLSYTESSIGQFFGINTLRMSSRFLFEREISELLLNYNAFMIKANQTDIFYTGVSVVQKYGDLYTMTMDDIYFT